jgi:hypothetical protein
MQPTQISDKKREANRRNAQHSTGPTTAKGKTNSSHNAVRHGFTGQVVILTPDDREAHDKFCASIIADLNPETAVEQQLAQSISEDFWRGNRLRATENNILAKASAGSQSEIETALDTADAFLRESKQLQLLTLYEQRINRATQKNMDQLRQLQTERNAGRKAQMEEAMLLAQLSLSKGMAYDPAIDFPGNGQACQSPFMGDTALSFQQSGQGRSMVARGFVYSSAEINQAIDRNNRLNEARRLDPNTPKLKKNHLAVAA